MATVFCSVPIITMKIITMTIITMTIITLITMTIITITCGLLVDDCRWLADTNQLADTWCLLVDVPVMTGW